jgi:hypothetical protein
VTSYAAAFKTSGETLHVTASRASSQGVQSGKKHIHARLMPAALKSKLVENAKYVARAYVCRA